MAGHYTLTETAMKPLGHLKQEDHPDGLLCRPCPVCGYKYGTKWLMEEVPDEVIEWLTNLPDSNTDPAWVLGKRCGGGKGVDNSEGIYRAFQYGIDKSPDWFIGRTVETKVGHNLIWIEYKDEINQTSYLWIRPREWIVELKQFGLMSLSKDRFNQKFTFVEGDIYRKKKRDV